MNSNDGKNKIIVSLDNGIDDGEFLVDDIEQCSDLDDMIYGYKVGSIWILEHGINAIEELFNWVLGDHRIILDMQKWPTDIPEIVLKQLDIVSDSGSVDEIIACPMGGGRDSFETFVYKCKNDGIRPLCALEMTHPGSDSYLKPGAWRDILHDAVSFGIDGFVLPATKIPKVEIKDYVNLHSRDLGTEYYSMGFDVQQGQIEPMRKFGVSKFIVGRAIYESEEPLNVIKNIYEEINIE